MIRVLIADDSEVVRQVLVYMLSSDPEIKIIATVNNGEDAVFLAQRERPDIIIMDINMPKMNGFEATAAIMENCPTPVIIISATENIKSEKTMEKVIEAGALAVMVSPKYAANSEFDSVKSNFIRNIKLMSEIKVVRRRPKFKKEYPFLTPEPVLKSAPGKFKNFEILAIGASTGGPIVLQAILSALPKNFPAPILIVQHITHEFTKSLVEWLSQTASMPIVMPAHGDVPVSGRIYIAPDDVHMGIDRNKRIVLSKTEKENGLRPAVSVLFKSVAENFGPRSVGVLLTGMGADGAKELKLMRDSGAITIAQDKESSVVYGMPAESVRLGGAVYELPPDEIIATLKKLAGF